MLKRTFLLCAMLLWALSLTATAQEIDKITFPKLNEFEIPKVEKIQLDNGMRIYLLPDKTLPLFNISVRINAGSWLEPADKAGLADLTATVMRTGGTRTWSGDEIDELLEGIGAAVETNMQDVEGGAFVNVLSEYVDTGLAVLTEVLRYPRFDQEKIDLALVQQRSNISRRNDEVGDIALREWRKLVYGPESPYARTVEYATLDNITREDLVAFHGQYIKPENIQIAVSGDFDKGKIVTKLKKLFGDWKRGSNDGLTPPPVTYDWRKKIYYAEKKDAKQSYIRIGHLGGLVKDPDYADKIVMNAILGGGFGSRLTDEVRTRLGLAYSAGGRYVSNFSYPGYFFAVASTDPGNTVKATRAMINEIKTMHTDPPTDMEMQKGKDGYLNSFVFNFDSQREIVNRIMSFDFYGLPENFLDMEKAGVQEVTKDAVLAASKRNLFPDSMIILVVGDSSKFDLPLDSIGWGAPEAVDIAIPAPKAADQAELQVNDANLGKGKEILARGIEAHGGMDAFAKVSTVTATVTLKLIMNGQEIPLGLKSWQQLPDNEKTELNAMGRMMVSVMLGDKGWQTNPQTGALEAMSPEDVASGQEDNARGTIRVFQAFNKPYYQAVYNGSGTVAGIPVDWVALVNDKGESFARFGFNTADGTHAAQSYIGQTPLGEGLLTETYSDLREFGGIKMPMVTSVEMNGQKVMEHKVSEYSVNAPIAAEVFAVPQ